MKSQCDMILADLKCGHALTGLDALRLYGCIRLSARIDEFEREGLHFDRRRIEVQCANGRKAHVTEYRLAGEQGELGI